MESWIGSSIYNSLQQSSKRNMWADRASWRRIPGLTPKTTLKTLELEEDRVIATRTSSHSGTK